MAEKPPRGSPRPRKMELPLRESPGAEAPNTQCRVDGLRLTRGGVLEKVQRLEDLDHRRLLLRVQGLGFKGARLKGLRFRVQG